MDTDPVIATADESLCSGCAMCHPICPYKAIDFRTITEREQGKEISRQVSAVNSGSARLWRLYGGLSPPVL